MIKLNGEVVNIGHFPDGSLLLKENSIHDVCGSIIRWHFESNEELIALIYLTKHLRSQGVKRIDLEMPYIPNARMDRVKNPEDVFTLRYFADIINYLNFNSVLVVDPHSPVSEALIDRIIVANPARYVNTAIGMCNPDVLFFPDAGASKRYSDMFPTYKYVYGNKKREWETGKIIGTEIINPFDVDLRHKNILIIDDICSKGTTFVKSAEALKLYDCGNISLYVTHCENTILNGEILDGGLINKVYTTNSIFTAQHNKVWVMNV